MRNHKIIIGFIFFLIFMWLCTLISKSVYTTKLPMVSTVSPEEKYVEHKVEAEGIVVEGGKQAVTALSGRSEERRVGKDAHCSCGGQSGGRGSSLSD